MPPEPPPLPEKFDGPVSKIAFWVRLFSVPSEILSTATAADGLDNPASLAECAQSLLSQSSYEVPLSTPVLLQVSNP